VGNQVVEDELIVIAGDRSRVFYVSDLDILVKFVTTLSDNIRRWPNKACFDQEEECPKPSSPVCFKSPGCYIPRDHSIYKESTGEQCVFVDDAINKLNQIDGTQHNDKVPHGRNLLAG
uniref:Uncharacterized protein n=1 Tax=Romanomermis culicivorax TaxID=13658 RepID=A0A915JTQ8_ROMCU